MLRLFYGTKTLLLLHAYQRDINRVEFDRSSFDKPLFKEIGFSFQADFLFNPVFR
jgi:hypothetical protein